jgi:hypothetical protein
MLRRVLAVLLLVCAFAPRAFASYSESRVTSEDVHALVARDGSTVVTHAFGVRVLAGTLRTLPFAGFDDDLRLRPTATVTAPDGRTGTASVVRDDKDIVHVTVDDPRGLKRGDYRFEVVYETSLAPRIVRDGAFDRVRFALPPLREGVDSARLVLDFPSAPTEPRADTGDDADLSTLRRNADHDELEIVRPHVAKGEAATFFARVDPKALSALPGAPPPVATAAPPPAPKRAPLATAIPVAVGALLLFALALAKGRTLAAVRGASPVGLVPLPSALRAVLAAALFGGGVHLESSGRLVAGAAVVAAALPLLAWRFRASVVRARARATWLVMKPSEAFAPEPSPADAFDATTARGALVLAVLAGGCGVACFALRAAGPAAPYLVAIDALALVPLFFTGTRRQMPPSARREGAALAPVARSLGSLEAVKVAPLARMGGDAVDELRLLASPRLAMAGALAIEVGVAWQRAGGASLPSYDVLVRVSDGTFAASKMTAAFPAARPLPGRKPEERVYRFEPDGPFAGHAATLVGELAEVLRDRRLVLAGGAFEGTDRRVPPNERRPQEAAA